MPDRPSVPESVFTYGAPQLKFGPGAADEIGHDLARLGARRVLGVTDPGVAATGTPRRVADAMAAFGIEAVVHEDARVEPTDESLLAAVEHARATGPWDAFVAVGGGSSYSSSTYYSPSAYNSSYHYSNSHSSSGSHWDSHHWSNHHWRHIHHDHHHDHHDHQHHDHHPAKSKGLHKDWRTWLVVGLMLAAMLAYVLTMDESLQPGAPPGERMPADAAP